MLCGFAEETQKSEFGSDSRIAATEADLSALRSEVAELRKAVSAILTLHAEQHRLPAGFEDLVIRDDVPSSAVNKATFNPEDSTVVVKTGDGDVGPGDDCEKLVEFALDAEAPQFNDNLQTMNVHEWCVIQSTRHSTNPSVGVMISLCSLVFVVVQLLLLASVVLESSFSRCTADDECLLGEWCSPALRGNFSTSPGVCFDCWSAKMFSEARFSNGTYEVAPDPFELMAEAAGDSWLRRGALHCAETDRYPNRCDHLVRNLVNISPLNLLVFVGTCVLVVAPILNDIDEVEDLTWLVAERMKLMKNMKRRHLVFVLAWLSGALRRFVLPMMIIGATLGLIMRTDFSSGNLLVNGIAISFVTTMDDSLGWMFLAPNHDADERKPNIPMLLWIFNRFYAASLMFAFFFTVIHAESLLAEYGNEAKYGSVCSDIREIVTLVGFYVCGGFALVYAFVSFALKLRTQFKSTDFTTAKDKVILERWHFSAKMWFLIKSLCRLFADFVVPALLVFTVHSQLLHFGPLVGLQVGNGSGIASSGL